MHILDYAFFVLNLGIGAAVGVYYIVRDHRRRKSRKNDQLNQLKMQNAPFLEKKENDGDKKGDEKVGEEEDNVSTSTRDYFIASKGTMSPFAAACSLFASSYSAVSLLALPGNFSFYKSSSLT